MGFNDGHLHDLHTCTKECHLSMSINVNQHRWQFHAEKGKASSSREQRAGDAVRAHRPLFFTPFICYTGGKPLATATQGESNTGNSGGTAQGCCTPSAFTPCEKSDDRDTQSIPGFTDWRIFSSFSRGQKTFIYNPKSSVTVSLDLDSLWKQVQSQ